MIFSPKLVTSCNDGARKMERTEQLHFIHQKLDFGKLKVLYSILSFCMTFYTLNVGMYV